MEILICGHRQAVKILEKSPHEIDVIFISGPDCKFAVENSHKIPELAKNCCMLLFHDISFPLGEMEPAKQEQIEEAINFSKGREKLIVACQMGVSRSSAVAYVIASSQVGPTEALKTLNPKIHSPNSLIVLHGSKILGFPEMVSLINEWNGDGLSWETAQTGDGLTWEDCPELS